MKRYKNILAILLALLTLCGFAITGFANGTDASQPEGHRTLVSGSSLDKIAIMDYDGSTLWQVPQSEFGWTEVNDADLLPNGNLVFAARASSGSAVYMIRPDYPNPAGYETLWTYQVPQGAENHTCQYLPDGGILVGEAYTTHVRIVELDAQGNVRKTLGSKEEPLKDLPIGANAHSQIRQLYKTEQGTYLVASANSQITIEYSATGEKLAQYPAGGFVAVKDKDGNVIVGGGDSLKITCFAPNGTQLWQIGQDDLPDVSLAWLAAVELLDNGNIVFANWGGHGGAAGNAVMEVTVPTADKPCEIVWSLNSGKNTSNVQILDHISDSVFEGKEDDAFESTSQNYRSPLDVVGSLLNDKVFVADETNNSVEIIRHSTGKLIGEIALNQKPNTLLLSADGKYLYVATGSTNGKVEVYNAETCLYAGSVSVGHTPSALALSQDGNTLYVANRFNGTVQTIALTDGIIAAGTEATEGVFVTREPMSMAVTDGKLYVGGHLPTGNMKDGTVSSEIVVVNTETMKVAKTVTMVSGSTNLKDIALSPDGEYLYATHALGRYNVATTHVDRGWIYTNAITEIRTSDDTVRATMLVDDLDWGAANPWGIDVTDDTIVLSISGTRELMILDRVGLREKIEKVHAGTIGGKGFLENAEDISVDLTFTTEFKTRIKLGQDGPRGIALVGNKIYTANYYSGSISIYNLNTKKAETVQLPTEKAEDDVRGGERLWNDATICMGQWQSCASCHPDARTDALNWDNMNDGIGTPKQARSMVGSWERGRVMASGIRPSTMAANRAGLKYICFNESFPESEMLKIDAYTQSLKAEDSPYLVDGKLTESALRGKVLFEGEANCAACHSGKLYGADMLIYDNYVQSETETRGLLVPPLVEAWRTAPYLHDGSASTILDVLTTRNVTGTHGNVEGLTAEELDDLCNYVLSLGTEPIEIEIVPTQIDLDVTVKLVDKTLTADQFTVELYEGETLLATKSNAADGTVDFDAIVYNEEGTHTYRIKQVIGDIVGVTYDTTEIVVTVTVSHKGDGKLFATVTGADLLTFRNVYKDSYVEGEIVDGYYYIDGVPTEMGLFKHSDGNYYYADKGGKLVVNQKFYAWKLNENCDLPEGNYYFDAQGRVILNGIHDGFYYENGKRVEKGLFEYNGDYYCSLYNGSLVTGKYYVWKVQEGLEDLNNAWRYFDEDGKLFQGIQYHPDKKDLFYFENGVVKEKGLFKYTDGNYYFSQYNGLIVTSKNYTKYGTGKFYVWKFDETASDIAEGWYFFGEDGAMLQGIHMHPEKNDLYYFVNGKVKEMGLFQYTDGEYYFSQFNGKIVTSKNYTEYGEGKFYVWKFHETAPAIKEGWYFFGEDGAMLQGIHMHPEKNDLYFFENGKVKDIGFFQYADGNYYCTQVGGKIITSNNYTQYGAGKYYVFKFHESVTDKKAGWYFFDETGKMIVK